MIKNERQYQITKAQANKFEQALVESEKRSDENSKIHPLLLKAQQDALRSQLEELRSQLEEYETVKSGRHKVIDPEMIEELPRALIESRIAAGLSQKELAERLGLKEQQIQRYEATEYASASLKRVKEVIKALGIKGQRPPLHQLPQSGRPATHNLQPREQGQYQINGEER